MLPDSLLGIITIDKYKHQTLSYDQMLEKREEEEIQIAQRGIQRHVV